MPRLLSAVLVAFCALVLASPAQADRGGKWRDWGGGEQHQRGDRDGNRDRDRRPPRDTFPQNDQQSDRFGDGGNSRPPWYSRRRHEHDRARDGVVRGRMMSLEELENRISRRTPGFRIGNPELVMYDGRPVYRMRWRTPDGHILIVFADAETGEVLAIRGR